MTAIGILLSIIWMGVLPFLGGCVLLPWFRKNGQKASIAFLFGCGTAIHFAAYEILTLAGRKVSFGMRTVSLIFAAGALLLALPGILLLIKNKDSVRVWEWKKLFRDPCFYAASALLIWHVLSMLLCAVPDPDDAFYSSLSSMSYAFDLLLEKDAYVGLMNRAIQKRYALSALPIYQAGLSYLSGGMHHLVIAHNLFPLFYIPLGYGLYVDIVRVLTGFSQRTLGKEKQVIPEQDETTLCVRILLALTVLHTVGDYYIFSQEAYLMTRMWQGKGLFAAIGIPLLFLLGIYAPKWGVAGYGMVLTAMIAIVFMGGTGLFLAPVELMLLAAALWFVSKEKKKSFLHLLLAGACCVPELIMALWMMR